MRQLPTTGLRPLRPTFEQLPLHFGCSRPPVGRDVADYFLFELKKGTVIIMQLPWSF
jgi:hypothetical protein